jgi:sialidase-1
MTRVFSFLTLLLPVAAPIVTAAPVLEKQDLFQAGNEGYFTYRIPGMVVTRGGVVLVTVEARRGRGGDWDENDVLLRRSVDRGRTWQKPRLLVANKTYGPGPISNFVMIADRDGTVHAVYCYDYRRVFYLKSADDGASFSAPVEITAAFEGLRREYPWKVIATGPAHGTQLRSGRMIVPIWMSDGSGKEMGKGKLGHRPSAVGLVYSDDHGCTWHTGEIVCRHGDRICNPNETVMVELADGRVLFNIRSESKENRRLVSISPDGIGRWSEPRFEPALLEPVCMASLIRATWPAPAVPSRILFANPDNLENELVRPGGSLAHDRKRLTVKMSLDECRTWPVSKVLEPGPSGYSDLALLPDGSVLCAYECGMVERRMTISRAVTLAHFNLEWLATRHPSQVQITPEVQVGGAHVNCGDPPRGLVVRKELGLLTAAAVDGQVVHRARPPWEHVFETRATITPRGDYLLMFPEGEHYSAGRGRPVNEMIAYRSSDKGRTWTGPRVAFHAEYSQHGFIPLVPRGSKRIYAFGTQPIPGKYDWRRGLQENAPIGFRWSDDDGRTWSDVSLIRPQNDPEFTGMSVMRMCETDRGTWLLGAHEGDWSVKPLRTRQYLLRSEDQGRTWTLLPGKRPEGWFAEGFDRMDEGRPIALGGARVMLMSRTPQGHLFTAWSADDGRTWTRPAPSTLVHPDAPPMVFHLSDGKTLVALHHNRHAQSSYSGLSAKMEGMKDRSEIWVSTSGDDGHTWSEPRFLLANAAVADLPNAWFNYQCSYLDAFVDGGVLHLFMPHRWQRALHLTIRESDLATLPLRAALAGSAAPSQAVRP